MTETYLPLVQTLQSTAKLAELLPQAVADALADEDLSPAQRGHLRGETESAAIGLRKAADLLEALLTVSR